MDFSRRFDADKEIGASDTEKELILCMQKAPLNEIIHVKTQAGFSSSRAKRKREKTFTQYHTKPLSQKSKSISCVGSFLCQETHFVFTYNISNVWNFLSNCETLSAPDLQLQCTWDIYLVFQQPECQNKCWQRTMYMLKPHISS